MKIQWSDVASDFFAFLIASAILAALVWGSLRLFDVSAPWWGVYLGALALGLILNRVTRERP